MKKLNYITPSWSFTRTVGMGGLLLLLVTACSTPESRIEKDPALYASFSPVAQDKVKQGKIDIGFTPDMVSIAWGKPDRKREVVEGKDKIEVWAYVASRQELTGYSSIITGRRSYTTVFYERATVTFTNGKVSKFTQ